MAIGATAVWEVRTTATGGANVNGGFYTSGGTDYSQQNGAQLAITTGTSAGAGAVILDAGATTAMIGNGIHVISGTNTTAGWYEITGATAGVSLTLDRNVTTGAGANIVANVGGALSLTSSDDAVFESMVAGNKMWVKSGTYAIGGTVSIAAAGGASSPIVVEGYQTTRGDAPTGTNRPLFNCAAAVFTAGANWDWYYMGFTGTATASVFSAGVSNKVIGCKFVNTSATAGRAGLQLTGANSFAFNCECVSYRGLAITTITTVQILYCYCHDSDIGISLAGTTNGAMVRGCISESNVTAAVKIAGAFTALHLIEGCTLYGGENKTGIGISIATGTTNTRFINNIIYGFTTGVNHADVQTVSYGDWNNYSNCTTARTNVAVGAHDQAIAPSFTNVAQKTGTTATTSGSVLTDSGASFTSGTPVVANQDYCYIVSGTGVTVGQYLITAVTATTLTLDIAPGTSAVADKVYQVTVGRNFGIGPASRALGHPGVIPLGGLSTGYTDIGAVQRREFITTGVTA